MSKLYNNTSELMSILTAINALPEAGGGSATPEDLDAELTEQETLIEQLREAVDEKASGGEDTRFKDYFEGVMTEIDDDSITILRAFAFRSATTLTSVHLPNVQSVGQSAFRECNELKTVDLPNLTGLTGTYFCSGCENLTQVFIPKVSGLSNYSFNNCSKLARLEVGNIGSIGTGCFASDDELETLIIRKNGSNIVTLANVNAFNNTKIQSGTGYVYFPKALVEAQKAETNWATYAAQIRAIEDYPEICG